MSELMSAVRPDEAHPVLLVEDDANLREALRDTLELAGFPVMEADNGSSALELLGAQEFGLVLTDVKMPSVDGHELLARIMHRRPDLPVLMMTAHGSVGGAVDAMRAGAVDYLQKPFERDTLIERVGRYLNAKMVPDDELVAVDPRTQDVLALAKRVAATDVTAMVCGESGTGKELIARYIHRHSLRRHAPFVAINCAAIPENLLEATLFGHEKGAYTGAHQARAGKFEQADQGTLLLDEVTEMDIGLQAKLLRVIQERELERVGGSKTISLDVRLVATTNRDLRAAVAEGRFREDLYYRLNVVPIQLPALRERRADIVPLALALLGRAARAAGRPVPLLTARAEHALRAHSWPGNVRELDNLMQRTLIMQPGESLDASDLCLETEGAPGGASVPTAAAPGGAPDDLAPELNEDLRSREQRLILETLATLRGNRQEAAERLGISPRTLRYKLARMRDAGVVIPGDR